MLNFILARAILLLITNFVQLSSFKCFVCAYNNCIDNGNNTLYDQTMHVGSIYATYFGRRRCHGGVIITQSGQYIVKLLA